MSTSAAAVESGKNLAELGILDRIIAETKLTPDDEAYDIAKRGVSAFIVGPAGYLDAQATYRIDARTRLSIAATNLTDTRDLAYERTPGRLLQIGSAGRQLSFVLASTW